MNKEIIYVNGFPKSGNTWVTRLIAEALDSPSGSGFKNGSDKVEAATEGSQRAGKYKVLKSHSILESFTEKELNKKIIIPIRDVRDVLVSQYYHEFTTLGRFPISRKLARNFKIFEFLYDFHKKKESTIDLELSSNLFKHLKKFFYRKDFESFIIKKSRLWSAIKLENKESVNTNWSSFNGKWHEVMKSKNNIVFIKYEDLLSDTYPMLIKIFDKLGVVEYSEENLRLAIKNQSFNNKKLSFINKESDAYLGTKYNANFLRKGESGDYKNYFQPSLENKIINDHKDVLNIFGYLN